jgi:hypothetical protein
VVAGTTSCVPCITRRRKHLPACYTSGTTAPVPIACSTGGLHCKLRLWLLCPENFAPVHTDCAAHLVPEQWYHVSFPRVKRPRRGADYPRPPSAEVKGRRGISLLPLSWPSWPPIQRTLPLPAHVQHFSRHSVLSANNASLLNLYQGCPTGVPLPHS